MPLTEHKRRQNIPSAADTDHEHRSRISQVVRERSDVVFQMLDTVEIPIELGDDGRRSRVDIQIQLLQLPARMIDGAHSPPERLGSKLTDMDSRKRVPFLIEPIVFVRAAFDPLNIDQLYGLIHYGRSQ